jgi:DNA modification methylase
MLAELPAREVNLCVSSPPYFKLRDYKAGSSEVGREKTVEDYIDRLVRIYGQVRRVLRDDGLLFLNIDDTYLERQLAMVPFRVALALVADGWRLRADIIWEKPNALPSPVTDRPTRSHEYLFMFSKGAKYHYDGAAIREPWTDARPQDIARAEAKHKGYQGKHRDGSHSAGVKGQPVGDPSKGRNKRTVWRMAHSRYKGAHCATFPEALAETCILAGCPMGGIVLDPFAGSGTTLAVAARLGRHYLGVELQPDYVPLIEQRLGLSRPGCEDRTLSFDFGPPQRRKAS